VDAGKGFEGREVVWLRDAVGKFPKEFVKTVSKGIIVRQAA